MIKYDVFLSYSHADLAIAEMLSKRIRRFKIPARLKHSLTKLEIFRDIERLTAGSDLSGLLTEHLNSSRHLVLLMSSAAKKSTYVNNEVVAFLKTHELKSIIFVLVEGEFADNLPPALQDQKIEPLYIDLRNPDRKKIRYETLRLIAALLDVDFTLLSLEDLKYRRRKRQLALAGLLTALIIAACSYLIISTEVYHWTIVSQPKQAEIIMPVHEIAVSRKDPSVVLFRGRSAKYANFPRPEGVSIKPVGENFLSNETIFRDKDLHNFIKKQQRMLPVVSLDFRLESLQGKGRINIYAVLSDTDSVYFFRDLYFKGKDLDGKERAIKAVVRLYLRHTDLSDLYPILKILEEEKITDFTNTSVAATIHNYVNGTTKKERFELKQNDAGYAEMVEIWAPDEHVFSNNSADSVMIDDQRLQDANNGSDLWESIVKDPAWMPVEKHDVKSIESYFTSDEVDSIPVVLARWFKNNIAFLTDPPSKSQLISCIENAELSKINVLLSTFGNQHGIMVEITGIMDNNIGEEKISCYLYKVAASKSWNTLQLPAGLANARIIDLIMLDTVGQNLMILTNNKGYFKTRNEGRTWEEANYGEIGFQNGARVKTLVTPSAGIYAFVDRNTSVNEGANNLFLLKRRNWLQRLRIGLGNLINE
ncbi:MAG: toll/interleukin-1 receptor domain-containing protein [Chitinophagaceae bacterium]